MPEVYLAADHAGFLLKEEIAGFLLKKGYLVHDFGTDSTETCDYPDFILPCAEAVAEAHGAAVGIVFGGSGLGECLAANKVKGIRAVAAYDRYTARMSRMHNNANVLSLGGPLHDAGQLCDMAKTWLETRFGGGRHMVRVNKIMAIERNIAGGGEE